MDCLGESRHDDDQQHVSGTRIAALAANTRSLNACAASIGWQPMLKRDGPGSPAWHYLGHEMAGWFAAPVIDGYCGLANAEFA